MMMRRKTAWMLCLALIVGSGPIFADHGHRNVVVSGSGEGQGDIVFADDVERFDLSGLADGETRYFGSGEHEVRATREGDRVTLVLGDEDHRELSCAIAKESCSVITAGDDGHVIVMKTAGGPHALHDVMLMTTSDDGGNVFFTDDHASVIAVDEDGPLHWVSADGEEGRTIVEIKALGAATVLRCPEGDTTMRLDEGEEDAGPYYCPKHDVPLEKVESRLHKAHESIRILVDDGGDQ